MKKTVFKIFMIFVFFQSHAAIGAGTDIDINQSNAQTQANLEKDEVCIQAQRPTGLDEQTYWYDSAYQQCLSRNQRRANIRAYTNRAASDASEVLSGTLKEPVNNCHSTISGNSDGYDYGYQSCMQNYNSQMVEYNRKKQAEELAKKVESQGGTSPEELAKQKELAALKDTSATGSMSEVQQRNENAKILYQTAAQALSAYAAVQAQQGTACAASCGVGGCCSMAPGFFAASAAFMLLNARANKQASENARSALQACQTYNQLSSSQKNCSGIETTPPPAITTMYDDTGKCKQPVMPGCVDIPKSDGKTPLKISGTNCKGISCLAGGPTLNPDGTVSVKTPQGLKKYSAADFANKKSMLATGLSAAAADMLMNDLYGKNNALAKAGLDSKNLVLDLNEHKGRGSFSDLGVASKNIVNINTDADNNKKFSEKLKDAASKVRGPTSEGLSRDFNGDLIGAAGDDIFSMLKRRYNLKNEQDSFIAP